MIGAAKGHLEIMQVLLAHTNGVDARNNKISVNARFWQDMSQASTEHVEGKKCSSIT